MSPRCYISGETQLYLERRYVLKVIIDPEQATGVKLTGTLTHDTSEGSNPNISDRAARVKSLLDGWYQSKAKTIFAERLDAMLPHTNWVNSSPTFKILSMKR